MEVGQFSEAISKAIANQPQINGSRHTVPGRLLAVDGDYAAYTFAGNDDTVPGRARANLLDNIEMARSHAGAENVVVFLTGRGSHKGHRFAVATVKPYQGQRSSSRRPKNWEYLRTIMETDALPDKPVVQTMVAEADDLFGMYSKRVGPENFVIWTKDKDMRMVPGHHLTWDSMRLTYLAPGVFEHTFEDLVYGRKWFWLQMLQGDPADYIPGLPKCINAKGSEALCGPATAEKMLADCTTEVEARSIVLSQYKAYWGDSWKINLIEQAILLWMRNDDYSSALNVMAEGNPLYGMEAVDEVQEILRRIAKAQV